MISKYTLLDKINSPEDLRTLNTNELNQLASEVRSFIIEVLSNNPGHLASGLGTVELTIALHYVFNTPDDKLIWDVGHQAYPHKILTGRKDRLHTIRSYKGLSGFPKMSESLYDSFGTGHSSTSISAALGMAIASSLQGDKKRQHIAVIGDGAMTGGMCFEALNHAGVSGANLLVILNDNGIAINKNVGALSEYLTKFTISKPYNRFKTFLWKRMERENQALRKPKNFFGKILFSLKIALLKNSTIFEAFKFRYFGPIDGHQVNTLVDVLNELKEIPGPKLLHVITKKGKGLPKAEKDPIGYHAPGYFDPITGDILSKQTKSPFPIKYQDVFGETILRLAKENPLVVGITPAMPSGSSLNLMMDLIPERAFDVGIAEQHAVTFAAGLAAQGMIVYCNIYSSFMQRAYDQVIHDVALQSLPVIFCLDRAGLVGEDGATHHGVFDLAFFRPIPNLIISSPLNGFELQDLLYTAQLHSEHPFIIRYPRAQTTEYDPNRSYKRITIGKGQLLKKGKDAAILSLGPLGNTALGIADSLSNKGLEISVYDMRFLKPIDEELLHDVCKSYSHLICLEDGVIKGGLASEILEFANKNNYQIKILPLGIPDHFIEHGSLPSLYKECMLDAESLELLISNFIR